MFTPEAKVIAETSALYNLVEVGAFAKLKKSQTSKIKVDRANASHPPPIQTVLFWKPITDTDRTLKS